MQRLLLLFAVASAKPGASEASVCEQTSLLQKAKARASELAPCDEMYELFNSKGLLNSAAAASVVQDALNKGIFSVEDMTDCGLPGRKTCSAWTLLRNDLPPMVFGSGAVFISILLDPDKAWDLVSSMAVPDGDTDSRLACSNGNTYQPSVASPQAGFGGCGDDCAFGPGKAALPQPGETWHCMTQSAAAANVTPGDIVYQPAGDVGQASVPVSCASDDYRCRFLNSGGCLSKSEWGNATACKDPSDPLFPQFQACYTFNEVSANKSEVKVDNFSGKYFEVRFDKTCSPCAVANKCVTRNAPSPDEPGWFPFYNQSANEFQMFVGEDGSQWVDRMYGQDALRYGIQTQWYAGGYQCKWDKSDWKEWTNAVRLNYETLLRSAEDGPPNGGNTWLFAYPDGGPWGFYNEVNLYIDNDMKSDQWKQQNEIFLNSIVGVSVNQQSCHSLLSFLNGTCTSKYPGDPVCCDVDCRCPWENLTKFETDLREATDLATQLASLLSSQLKRSIPVQKFYPMSPTAPNKKVFEQFASSDGYPYGDLFKPL